MTTKPSAADRARELLAAELDRRGMLICAKSVRSNDPDKLAILPSAALSALAELAAENEALRRERDEMKAAKWDVKHVDAMNDMVAMGLARDTAEQRVKGLEEALGEYGRCKPLCARVGGYGYCDCGYEAALSAGGSTQ